MSCRQHRGGWSGAARRASPPLCDHRLAKGHSFSFFICARERLCLCAEIWVLVMCLTVVQLLVVEVDYDTGFSVFPGFGPVSRPVERFLDRPTFLSANISDQTQCIRLLAYSSSSASSWTYLDRSLLTAGTTMSSSESSMISVDPSESPYPVGHSVSSSSSELL